MINKCNQNLRPLKLINKCNQNVRKLTRINKCNRTVQSLMLVKMCNQNATYGSYVVTTLTSTTCGHDRIVCEFSYPCDLLYILQVLLLEGKGHAELLVCTSPGAAVSTAPGAALRTATGGGTATGRAAAAATFALLPSSTTSAASTSFARRSVFESLMSYRETPPPM
jgi:hypothetical protein